MKIVSWNVNGIRSVVKKGFFEAIKKLNPDIICLQEIKINEEIIKPLGFEYNLYFSFAEKKGYSGTAIFSKIKAINKSTKIGLPQFDNEGRFLKLDFEEFSLINLYMPHGSRDKSKLDYKLDSYSHLFDYLKNQDGNFILAGDFNVAHKEADLANPRQNKNNIMFTQKERERVDELINLGFVDCFRKINPNVKKFSWWPYFNNLRERNVGWRIDYFFVDEKFIDKLTGCDYLNEIGGSDHCPVLIELK